MSKIIDGYECPGDSVCIRTDRSGEVYWYVYNPSWNLQLYKWVKNGRMGIHYGEAKRRTDDRKK